MTYKGKPMTVATVEMLVRTITDARYVPPLGTEAHNIWIDNDWLADPIWDYINDYVDDRPK